MATILTIVACRLGSHPTLDILTFAALWLGYGLLLCLGVGAAAHSDAD